MRLPLFLLRAPLPPSSFKRKGGGGVLEKGLNKNEPMVFQPPSIPSLFKGEGMGVVGG